MATSTNASTRKQNAAVIRGVIRKFIARRRRFRMDELHTACNAVVVCAPGTPERIARRMRNSGDISYRCVDNQRGIYITGVTVD
jgi:hypothetical protein